MSLSVISFTENGMRLSEKIAEVWEGEEVLLFTRCTAAEIGTASPVRFAPQSVGEWAREQMERKNTLLFIGACGIAVRAIAPCLTDKLHDSPVLVMDEKGAYIIPILSGHMGGANETARQLARRTGAIPVITTATDLQGRFAVDLFAKKNGFHIGNREGIARVSAKVLAGEEITISAEEGHMEQGITLPEGVRRIPYPPEQFADVVITTQERIFEAALLLRPRIYVIGMGCKRGKETEEIDAFIRESLQEAGIESCQLLALASIDRKRDEEGLLAFCRKADIPFYTYTARQLQEVAGVFHASAFVREQVGTDNVCERAALRACGPGGELVYEKHARDGMTIAIARREWRVNFEEE